MKRALQGNRICPICRTKITNSTKIHYEIKTPRKNFENQKELANEEEVNQEKKCENEDSIRTKRKLIEENVKISEENLRLKDLLNDLKRSYEELHSEIDIKITQFEEICV